MAGMETGASGHHVQCHCLVREVVSGPGTGHVITQYHRELEPRVPTRRLNLLSMQRAAQVTDHVSQTNSYQSLFP